MRRLFYLSIATIAIISQPALACTDGRIQADAKWCMEGQKDGYADLVVGSCKKDANKTRDGFRSCQGDKGVRDNYDSCSAGVQIDSVRAAGRELNIYNPAECGF